jgi:hypothetical protein
MIDIEQIFKEVISLDNIESVDRWAKIAKIERVGELLTRMLAHATTQNKALLALLVIDPDGKIIDAFHAYACVMFEAGRLYGRSELINELDGSKKDA